MPDREPLQNIPVKPYDHQPSKAELEKSFTSMPPAQPLSAPPWRAISNQVRGSSTK